MEAFAAARARRLGTVSSASTEGAGAGGGRVVLRRWESAAHCEIGKDHPEAYAAAPAPKAYWYSQTSKWALIGKY
mgnify:CR=1 FL=1